MTLILVNEKKKEVLYKREYSEGENDLNQEINRGLKDSVREGEGE